MKRKMTRKMLAAVLSTGMLAASLSGSAIASETADLSEITIGPGWKIDTSKDYSGDQYQRFDGVEFTRVVNTSGFDTPEGMSIDDNDRVWMFELKSGLSPKTIWSANGDAYTQKLNACIASGEIPDMMEVNINQYYALVKAGLIADLTDELLEGNHPGIQGLYAMGDNKALETLTVNGRIYGIPQVYMSFDAAPLVWIRQDWMDKLDLEEPKTYDDLAEIAKAFMEADLDGNGADDTYGIPVLSSYEATGGDGNLGDLFLNIGGAAPGLWQKEEDGTVIYGSLMDGAKEALTFLNNWYEEGIIPSDFATWNGDTLKQIIGEDKAGIVFGPWYACWSCLSSNISLNEEAVWTAYMLSGEEGAEIRSAAGNPVWNICVVSKDFEDPSMFVYAADMLVNGYEIDTEASGFDGITFETQNAYAPLKHSSAPLTLISPMKEAMEKALVTGEITTREELSAFVSEQSNGIIKGTEDQFTLMFDYGVPVTQAIKEGKSPREVTVGDQDALTVYNNYVACTVGIGALANTQPVGVSTAFMGTTDSMTQYQTFLSNFEEEEYTKMIMGDTDGKTIEEYFDSFVESYLAQGGADITAEVQEIIGG